jgi:hypothetical protein
MSAVCIQTIKYLKECGLPSTCKISLESKSARRFDVAPLGAETAALSQTQPNLLSFPSLNLSAREGSPKLDIMT